MRVKVRWVGVCGSDVEVYRGTRKPEWLSLPARLGHEVAGVIDKLGAHVRGLAVGDQVICRYIWGGFAEYVVCRPFNVKKLPPGFPLKEASLIEILPGILHAAELATIDPGHGRADHGPGRQRPDLDAGGSPCTAPGAWP